MPICSQQVFGEWARLSFCVSRAQPFIVNFMMNHSLYFLLIFVASIASVSLLFRTEIFRFLDEESSSARRVIGLDGLRFYLASFVVLHHIDCFHSFVETGRWAPSQYYLWALGKYGVALFFMITAFLFWGKIRNKENVDWISLYRGRVFRIAPMAIFSSLVAVTIITIYSSGTDGFFFNIKNVIPWFDASIFDFKPAFTNFKTPQVAMAGVTWSLKWEWMFYFLLPLLFIFRNKGLEFSIAACALCFYILPQIYLKDAYIWSYFAFGILCKELSLIIRIDNRASSILALTALLVLFASEPGLFSVTGTPLLAVIFLCVACGSDVFGSLSMRSSKRLGAISYSIYIMQGPVLFTSFMVMKKYNLQLYTMTSAALVTLTFTLLCMLCSITYVLVEKRFMHGFFKRADLKTQ